MIGVAQKLACGLDFIRVDFYTDGKDFFLGEMTNFHASASQRFIPSSAECVVSDIIFSERSSGVA
jgi:teichuronopeptide biosynthesis TupA-like protein